MKPIYQFPIPPLRPISSLSSATPPNTGREERREDSSEPLPKRIRLNGPEEEVAQEGAAFENPINRLMDEINGEEPSTATTIEVA